MESSAGKSTGSGGRRGGFAGADYNVAPNSNLALTRVAGRSVVNCSPGASPNDLVFFGGVAPNCSNFAFCAGSVGTSQNLGLANGVSASNSVFANSVCVTPLSNSSVFLGAAIHIGNSAYVANRCGTIFSNAVVANSNSFGSNATLTNCGTNAFCNNSVVWKSIDAFRNASVLGDQSVNQSVNRSGDSCFAHAPPPDQYVGALVFGQNALAQNLTSYLNAWDTRWTELNTNSHEAAKIYDDELFSKREFWDFYRKVDRYSSKLTGSVLSDLAGFRESDLSSLPEQFQLSARQIEIIFRQVVSSVEEISDVFGLVFAVRETLRREIERLAYCISIEGVEAAPSIKGSTRDRILSLAIRTGSSPPAAASARPAGRKVRLENPALQVNNASICGQKNRAYLPYPLCQRRKAARINQGARGHAAPRCKLQPSRRVGHRTDFPVAKNAWPVWPSYRRQMVRDFSLVG